MFENEISRDSVNVSCQRNGIIVLLLIVFLFPFILRADKELGSPFIKNYFPVDYNGNAQNWDVVQDSRGVTYFASTGAYILQFDGINWKKCGFSPNNSTIRSLAIDKNDTVYVGSVDEFGYLEPDKDGEMAYVSLVNKLKKEDRNFYDVWHVYSTSHGVYFFTMSKIFRYFEGKLEVFKALKEGGIIRGVSTVKGNIFFVTKEGLSVIINGKSYVLPHTSFLQVKKNYVQAFSYPDDKIIIITEKQGTYIYDFAKFFDENIKKKNLSNSNISEKIIKKFHTKIDDYVKVHHNYCGASLLNYHYAIGTATGGIVIMDSKGEIVRFIGKNQGLPNYWVFAIYPDREGNLWVTLNGLISYVEISSPISIFNELNGLEAHIISVKRYKENLYVGDFKGLYSLDYHPDDNITKQNNKPAFKPLLKDGSCWAFMNTHNILLAGGRFGVAVIGSNGIFQRLKTNNIVNVIATSKLFPNYVFIGLGNPYGLNVIYIQPVNNVDKHIKSKNDSFANIKLKYVKIPKLDEIKYSIMSIVPDAFGNLWLGTENNGIIYVRFKNKEINDCEIFHYTNKNGLPQNKITSITIKEKYLIFTTVNGIYKSVLPVEPTFNTEKLSFIPEYTYGKWFNDKKININEIVIKDKDSMLINTGTKIYEMTRKDNNTYSRRMLPLQKTKASTFIGLLFEKNGIAWIGSNLGLFRYDFKKKKNYNPVYYTLIRKVTVGDKRLVFKGTNYSVVNAETSNEIKRRPSINQPDALKVVLDYSDNNIIFEYAAPFFEFPQDIRFSYYLEGMDKKWSDWTDKTLKEYTNIYSGQYCFKVKAKNIFGNESKIASYEFKVLAPWYLTIYAYFAYVILLIIIIIIAIQLHSYRLIRAKRNLEKIVRRRTAEIVKQKDEIAKQKSYLQEQAEQLTETNVELEVINKELEKLSIVVSETDNAVLLMDMDGNIEWVNEGFSRMYEDTLEQFVNERGGNIIEISSNENIKSFLDKCKTTFESIKYESLNTTRTGRKIWTYTSLTPILGDDGKVEKLIAIDSDITKIKQAEEKLKEAYIKLEEIANIDALTEIPNRRVFEENVLMEWRRCYRYKMPISLIMIDIDNFKMYNDTYGHQRGDICLKTLGVILKYSLNRVGDSPARYGGEEFAVILSDTDKNGALKIAESIRTRVESLRIKHSFGVNNIVTISLGVATLIPDDPEDYNKLIKAADNALYESKESGRNMVTLFKT